MPEEMKQEDAAEESSQGSGEKETPSNDASKDMRGMIDQFEATLDEYMVKKAPFHIPAGGKDFLVKVAPYFIIVFAILTLPVIVAGLGLTALLTPFAAMGGYYSFGALGLLSVVFAAAALIVELMAVKGLFKQTHASWRLLYYASLIGFAGNIVSLNIVSGIIGSIIGWYILFQVKERYKN
ncbi:MAG: hypothetical protein PHT88_04285 [Candidatus Moranbacteria bacterium]|nr:hypothetical protein [Candidatus Moranbacteria bacterium]